MTSVTVMNWSLRLVRELLTLSPLDGVQLSVEFHCECYLLNMDAFAVVIEWRFVYISGNG